MIHGVIHEMTDPVAARDPRAPERRSRLLDMRTDEPAENATRLSVVVCDDHPIVRLAMKIAVIASPTLALAAEPVPAAAAVVEMCKELRPDVCVIGINLGSRPHAIEATRAVRRASPSTKVLVLSAYTNDETVLSAIEAGANGFVQKGSPLRPSFRRSSTSVTADPSSIMRRFPVASSEHCADTRRGLNSWHGSSN